MLQALTIILAAAVIIGYYPLQLHLDSMRLAQPVVVFRGCFWRAVMMPWVVGALVFASALLVVAALLATRSSVGPLPYWERSRLR